MKPRSAAANFHGVWGATFALEAAWAHPLWSQYVIAVYDLTSNMDGQDRGVFFAKPGMTHEMMVMAVDPQHPIPDTFPAQMKPYPRTLRPMNHGYQFVAESNEAAFDRIQRLVDMIEAKQLSPDTDFRQAWDHLFKDGASLLAEPVLTAVIVNLGPKPTEH